MHVWICVHRVGLHGAGEALKELGLSEKVGASPCHCPWERHFGRVAPWKGHLKLHFGEVGVPEHVQEELQLDA